jgi:hypothetical protein
VRSLLTLLLLLSLPGVAHADTARLQALGDADLFTEDSSNVFTNPALMARYSNRAWFSLGVSVPSFTPDGLATTRVSPLGGVAVRIKKVVTLGVVLNRDPQLYGFGNALWPVLNEYMPQGPGGLLAGPAGPAETTAPLAFPLDFFMAFGDQYSKLRIGFNLYYAGGNSRDWGIDDSDRDDLEDVLIISKETHLFNASVGISGGSIADRIRPEAWVRVSFASAWHDEQGTFETSEGETEPTVDRILSMDRDLRVGGGFRMHIGDAERGVLVTPGLQYDIANGAFRYDDNLVAPDGPDELALRDVLAHDARAGLGIAYRAPDLLVQGSIGLRVRALSRTDTLDNDPDGIERFTDDSIDLAVPELSIGAEYKVHPVVVMRAGIRSTVVGGRNIRTVKAAEGNPDAPFEYDVVQSINVSPVSATLSASGGIGLHVKRFQADLIVGSLFVGSSTGTPSLFTRLDVGFDFD